MKRLLPVLALFAVLCGCCSCGRVIPTDGEVAVVPLPEHIVEGQGTFRLTSDAEVVLLCSDSGLADCLTTGLFCMPLEEGQKIVESLDGVEALWCTTDQQVVTSSGWDEYLKK